MSRAANYRLSNFIRNSITVLDQAFATAKGVSRGTRDFRGDFPDRLGKSYFWGQEGRRGSFSQFDLLLSAQEWHILQWAQFPPQLDLPARLSLISFRMIPVTAKIRISDTMIFPMFCAIQKNNF